ncbi:MAG: hypothetical protein RI958_1645 [Actinomycetota bacterium]
MRAHRVERATQVALEEVDCTGSPASSDRVSQGLVLCPGVALRTGSPADHLEPL